MSEGRRLGRGLEALLGPVSREAAQAAGQLRELPVNEIVPNPYQPRTRIDEAALQELVDSIAGSGLLQPIVVRSRGGNHYELVAGERRWRAVQRLGWAKVPAVVRDIDDRTLLTLAIIENVQRNDLSAIDEAKGYQRMMDEFAIPQAEVARLTGRNRATIANLLRLLRLPDDVQQAVHEGRLSEGHARALLTLGDDGAIRRLAAEAALAGWSVREVEERVRRGGAPARMMKRPAPAKPVTADVRRVEETLQQRLGTDVRVTMKRRGRGMVSISYYSNEDLARLLEMILGEPFAG